MPWAAVTPWAPVRRFAMWVVPECSPRLGILGPRRREMVSPCTDLDENWSCRRGAPRRSSLWYFRASATSKPRDVSNPPKTPAFLQKSENHKQVGRPTPFKLRARVRSRPSVRPSPRWPLIFGWTFGPGEASSGDLGEILHRSRVGAPGAEPPDVPNTRPHRESSTRRLPRPPRPR